MTTNILLLPKFSATSTFTIVLNSDWLDTIEFTQSGYPNVPVTLSGCSITSGQNAVAVSSTAGLVPGQTIAGAAGIPSGAFVGAITSATQFNMVNASGSALNATETDAEATLTFSPPPLDITGIDFICQVRQSTNGVIGTQVFISAQTADQSFTNGGATGVLAFNVTQSTLKNSALTPGIYVMDIVAEADGHTINLFPQGPATLTVLGGVTTP